MKELPESGLRKPSAVRNRLNISLVKNIHLPRWGALRQALALRSWLPALEPWPLVSGLLQQRPLVAALLFAGARTLRFCLGRVRASGLGALPATFFARPGGRERGRSRPACHPPPSSRVTS